MRQNSLKCLAGLLLLLNKQHLVHSAEKEWINISTAKVKESCDSGQYYDTRSFMCQDCGLEANKDTSFTFDGRFGAGKYMTAKTNSCRGIVQMSRWI